MEKEQSIEEELLRELFKGDTKVKDLNDLEREQLLADLEEVLRKSAGQRFMWWLLSETHLFSSNFTGQSNSTIFREGERNIGLKVLNNVLSVDKHFFVKMLNAKLKTSTKEA